MCGFEGAIEAAHIASSVFIHKVFLHSSMVEHAAVNRGVVGSSPTGGAIQRKRAFGFSFFFFDYEHGI